ncbi:MAG TPA: hypothetical protein DHU63_04805 [Candidatus Marinimicrobia bacterium]|nr:MAG: hypothetical protein AUJ47_13480 [Candidatus Marinimicrobia bacterium CG1_02_48_14]PJA54668.1 MAG: hypothetical protein CO167_02630 [Candidatus Marinimicrobia bacterium CG_4_9_14_3_um_filter_48_9]HCW75842.1 hypothetical protein [Candidatus Neomarinimicrobiota bacterium]
MDPRKRNLGLIILAVIIGAVTGSVLGNFVGMVMPQGVVRDFFLLPLDSSVIGLVKPFTLNLHVISLTLGLTFRINIVGILGIGLALYVLRYYRS